MGLDYPLGRRAALKSGALGIGALVAGCLSSGGSSDGGVEWPPASGRIEIGNVEPAGASHYFYNLMLTEHLRNHIQNGEEMDYNLQALDGGGGLTLSNYTYRAPPDGSFIGHTLMNAHLNNKIFQPDIAEYNYDEFAYPASPKVGTRTININPRTTDVSEPFEWTWDDFLEQAEDLRYGLLGEGHGSTSAARALGLMHPDLDLEKMEENFIMYPGGSETRAAFQRGEVDVYMGSFEAQWGERQEYYKMQLVMTDGPDNYIQAMNDLTGLDVKTLRDTDYTQDQIDFITAITFDMWFWMLPPETPDGIVDIWVDAFDSVLSDEEYTSELHGEDGIVSDEMFDLYWKPTIGHDKVLEMIEKEWNTRQNNIEDFKALVGAGSE